MMNVETLRKTLCAGAALAAGCAFAVTSTETFESATANEFSVNGWTGDGLVISDTISSAPAGGFPASEANHDKTLSVDGEVQCMASANAVQSNFLLYLDEASEVLDSLTDAQIAIAAGTSETAGSVPLMLWCKNKSGTAGWYEVGTVALTTWHHVQFKFDYVNSLCQVSIGGMPVVSTYGYLESSTSNTSADGAWYKLAADNKSSIGSISFIGSAKTDDMVFNTVATNVVNGNNTAFTPAGVSGTTYTIPYETLTKYGVTAETITTAKLGSSGRTVWQSLECGLDPDSDVPFVAKDMTLAAGGVPTLVFPGSVNEKNGITPRYSVKVLNGADEEVTSSYDIGTATAGTANGTVNVTVTAKSGTTEPAVVKYVVTASATPNNN